MNQDVPPLARPPFGPYSPVRPLRYGDERFQDTPGWPEYPAYSADIVSCGLPSGAAWLFSCLLELGVPAWKPWNADTTLEWIPHGDYRYRYSCAGDPWSRLAPGLVSGREFAFRAQTVPRYTHAWPGVQPRAPRTILIVRDPRDALYSAWRREEVSLGLDGLSAERFIAYAKASCVGENYRRADYWDRFHAIWLDSVAAEAHLIVRFEDFKHDPLVVLGKVCSFLDLAAEPREMADAIAVSDFGSVARIDQDMVRRGVFNWTLNRAGIANEFVTTFSTEMRRVCAGADTSTWRRLGYDPQC